MKREDGNVIEIGCRGTGPVVSRRAVVGLSGVAALGLVSRSCMGQENREAGPEGAQSGPSKEARQRMEQFRAEAERMRNASPEERTKIMEERRAQDRQRTIDGLKDQLQISEKDWPIVKPRIERVYNLVHPASPMRGGNERPRTEAEQRRNELRDLLRDNGAAVDQIKARLDAYRAAKGKEAQELATARQELRQLMSVRQEAVLVLNSLLD